MERSLLAQSAFFANMSHEIRTPLHGILGITRRCPIRTSTTSRPVRKHHPGQRHALMRIVNDILDLSKLEAGKLELEQERPGSARRRGAGAVVAQPGGVAEGTLADCAASRPSWTTRARGDAMRLQQVLNNLISNAIKFTRRGGVSVTLAAADSVSDGRSYRISVSDTGIGIEDSAIDRVFDPFEQADNSTSRRYGGTGLGLAIVKRLVREFEGNVAVESTVGRGSTFTFTCCLANPRTNPAEGPTLHPKPASLSRAAGCCWRRTTL